MGVLIAWEFRSEILAHVHMAHLGQHRHERARQAATRTRAAQHSICKHACSHAPCRAHVLRCREHGRARGPRAQNTTAERARTRARIDTRAAQQNYCTRPRNPASSCTRWQSAQASSGITLRASTSCSLRARQVLHPTSQPRGEPSA
eukprot:9601002-Alexandrium_andersonii.AAC.2